MAIAAHIGDRLTGDSYFLETKLSTDNQQRFLKFPLFRQLNGLVSLGDLQGVVSVNLRDILPVPQVNEFLLGIMNWRGEAIWLLDLIGVLGAPRWGTQEAVLETGMALLAGVEGLAIGLLVEQVNTIESYDPEKQLPAVELMLKQPLQKFVEGYFIDPSGCPCLVLKLAEIVAAIAD